MDKISQLEEIIKDLLNEFIDTTQPNNIPPKYAKIINDLYVKGGK